MEDSCYTENTQAWKSIVIKKNKKNLSGDIFEKTELAFKVTVFSFVRIISQRPSSLKNFISLKPGLYPFHTENAY